MWSVCILTRIESSQKWFNFLEAADMCIALLPLKCTLQCTFRWHVQFCAYTYVYYCQSVVVMKLGSKCRVQVGSDRVWVEFGLQSLGYYRLNTSWSLLGKVLGKISDILPWASGFWVSTWLHHEILLNNTLSQNHHKLFGFLYFLNPLNDYKLICWWKLSRIIILYCKLSIDI